MDEITEDYDINILYDKDKKPIHKIMIELFFNLFYNSIF
jgi:hypothetical protein